VLALIGVDLDKECKRWTLHLSAFFFGHLGMGNALLKIYPILILFDSNLLTNSMLGLGFNTNPCATTVFPY
jgi:hypothetical protein